VNTPANNSKLTGLIERVTFHNPENGFCVIKVKVQGKKNLVTVISNSPSIFAGEHIECFGQWLVDKKHGLQFRAEKLKSTAPTSLDGIEKYLASGFVKGIGAVYAKKLTEVFGEDVFFIIEDEPWRLKDVPGIGRARAKLIKESWDKQKAIREIILFLHSHNVGTAKATRIYKEYGNEAINIIEQNPYRLATDIKGIGFKSADIIAESVGIARNSIIRAKAGINYALTSAMGNGNCGLPVSQLIKLTQKLLEIPNELIMSALEAEIAEKNVITDYINDESCVFLKGLAVSEQQIAQTLVKISRGKLPWPIIDDQKAIQDVMKETGVTLSDSQQKAIKWILCSGVSVVTGGPGVGKTTLINSVLKILKKTGVRILLAAPTGRAAKRLSEATGSEATTIHRLLKRNPDQEFHKTHAIKCQLLIVDEVSMLDIPLMHAILKALPENASLLLVGDIDQLPSVGPGQVLGDIINSGGITVVHLTEVFRQKQESSIITNAYRINQGLMPILKQPEPPGKNSINDFYFLRCTTPEQVTQQIISLVKVRLPSKFGLSPLMDIQVLSPMIRGETGTRNLNIELQNALNPYTSGDNEIEAFGSCFRKGDKVMQTSNNYDKDIYNGDIGIISEINKTEQELTISFDNRKAVYEYGELDEIIHAYATTIHKSQGSEYHTVIIPLMIGHYTMLQRNLIYTAVTRGKRLVILIGEEEALKIAVNKPSAGNRYSTLKKRLIELTELY
jgi:exodeoxyribonuclease V alpha subunit